MNYWIIMEKSRPDWESSKLCRKPSFWVWLNRVDRVVDSSVYALTWCSLLPGDEQRIVCFLFSLPFASTSLLYYTSYIYIYFPLKPVNETLTKSTNGHPNSKVVTHTILRLHVTSNYFVYKKLPDRVPKWRVINPKKL